jgi:hypothetical protein
MPEDQEYFVKKGSRFARKQIWGTTKNAIAKKTGFYCKVCGELLLPDQISVSVCSTQFLGQNMMDI